MRDGAKCVLDAGPPAYTALISAELDTYDDVEEGLRCEASGLHP
jgi:hypothetical protein